MATTAVPRIVGFTVSYAVLADGYYEAIAKAVLMLRSGVRVIGVLECEQGTPGWWDVRLAVEETL